jgi:hypothetical protein
MEETRWDDQNFSEVVAPQEEEVLINLIGWLFSYLINWLVV